MMDRYQIVGRENDRWVVIPFMTELLDTSVGAELLLDRCKQHRPSVEFRVRVLNGNGDFTVTSEISD